MIEQLEKRIAEYRNTPNEGVIWRLENQLKWELWWKERDEGLPAVH